MTKTWLFQYLCVGLPISIFLYLTYRWPEKVIMFMVYAASIFFILIVCECVRSWIFDEKNDDYYY